MATPHFDKTYVYLREERNVEKNWSKLDHEDISIYNVIDVDWKKNGDAIAVDVAGGATLLEFPWLKADFSVEWKRLLFIKPVDKLSSPMTEAARN